MDRIVFSTNGSLGDLYPLLAIAAGLQIEGYAITFVVSHVLALHVQRAGFIVQTMPNDVPLARNALTLSKLGTLREAIHTHFVAALPAQIAVLYKAAKSAALLVTGSHLQAASIVADILQIPWASVAVTPLALPSVTFAPMPLFPLPLVVPDSQRWIRGVGYWWNRGMWRVTRRIVQLLADPPLNDLRRRYGLRSRTALLLDGNVSNQCVIVPVSPEVLPRPWDWPGHIHITGFCAWTLPDWQPSPELLQWVEQGRPIVAVSFGSATRDATLFAAMYETSIAAVRAVGARAVVVGAPHRELPTRTVFHLERVPFSWLLYHSHAVIHHGGMGTLAAALQAGLPSMIVPWGYDQFWNAARAQQMGVGRWIPGARFTENVARATLHTLLTTSAVRGRVQTIGERIRGEHGATRSAMHLQRLIH